MPLLHLSQRLLEAVLALPVAHLDMQAAHLLDRVGSQAARITYQIRRTVYCVLWSQPLSSRRQMFT